MSRDLLSRYIWIVDTINRHGSISLKQLAEKWENTSFGREQPLSRRTFYNYRQAIADVFQIQIECKPNTYEYHIPKGSGGSESVTRWLLNTAAMNEVIGGAGDVSGRIFVDDVPSAHVHLATIVGAIRSSSTLRFNYLPFSRMLPTKDVMLNPYFLKLFRQRWYITGVNLKEQRLKTYALDRMDSVHELTDSKFEMPADFDAAEYMRYSFGIVFDEGEPRTVIVQANPRLAKYLRALPLHHSQRESVHDSYSVFTYTLKITHDLVEELLRYGPELKVLMPRELCTMMRQSLEASLAYYKGKDQAPVAATTAPPVGASAVTDLPPELAEMLARRNDPFSKSGKGK